MTLDSDKLNALVRAVGMVIPNGIPADQAITVLAVAYVNACLTHRVAPESITGLIGHVMQQIQLGLFTEGTVQ
jgi:hypothetical protein